mgnify:CR=1 FL=1
MQTVNEILKIKNVKNTAVRTVVLRHLLSQEKAQSLKDLENALSKNWRGLLHGAWHTQSDLIKLQQHINNIENLKTL